MSQPVIRTCVACGRKGEKRGFLRVGRDKTGYVSLSKTGRGAYLCIQEDCIIKAFRSSLLLRPLHIESRGADWDKLEKRLLERVKPVNA